MQPKNEYLEKFYEVAGRQDRGYFASPEVFMQLHRMREVWTRQYSWAIPSQEALERVASNGPIVEIGAGTGYWAHLLRQMGVDVVAYDADPPEPGSTANHWHQNSKLWTTVKRGGPEKAKKHSDRALFLCWPPYGTPMGYDCLRHYKGDTVLYVGEDEWGCTGDADFHKLLADEFNHQDTVWLPNYDGIHDALHIHTRA